MAQTLVRILFHQPWTFEFTAQSRFLGVGWLLIPWVLMGLGRLWLGRRNRGDSSAEAGPVSLAAIGLWIFGGIVIVTVGPTLARFAPEGVPIYGYGFMLFLGFVVGAWSAARRAARVGIPGEHIWDLAMWIFFAGVGGSRLFYIVQYRERVFAGKQGADLIKAAVNLPDGGLVLYGGVLLSIAAFLVFCRIRQLKPLLLMDVIVPSFFVGLGFGRLGCFLNGCCYGDRCALPWSVQFPPQSVPFAVLVERGFLSPEAAATIPLHPTQLYSSLNAFLLAWLMAVYFRYRQRDGSLLALALLIYPVTRFLIEYVRGDELGKFNTSLTISQWVSLSLFLFGILFTTWLLTRRGPDATHPTPGKSLVPG